MCQKTRVLFGLVQCVAGLAEKAGTQVPKQKNSQIPKERRVSIAKTVQSVVFASLLSSVTLIALREELGIRRRLQLVVFARSQCRSQLSGQ